MSGSRPAQMSAMATASAAASDVGERVEQRRGPVVGQRLVDRPDAPARARAGGPRRASRGSPSGGGRSRRTPRRPCASPLRSSRRPTPANEARPAHRRPAPSPTVDGRAGDAERVRRRCGGPRAGRSAMPTWPVGAWSNSHSDVDRPVASRSAVPPRRRSPGRARRKRPRRARRPAPRGATSTAPLGHDPPADGGRRAIGDALVGPAHRRPGRRALATRPSRPARAGSSASNAASTAARSANTSGWSHSAEVSTITSGPVRVEVARVLVGLDDERRPAPRRAVAATPIPVSDAGSSAPTNAPGSTPPAASTWTSQPGRRALAVRPRDGDEPPAAPPRPRRPAATARAGCPAARAATSSALSGSIAVSALVTASRSGGGSPARDVRGIVHGRDRHARRVERRRVRARAARVAAVDRRARPRPRAARPPRPRPRPRRRRGSARPARIGRAGRAGAQPRADLRRRPRTVTRRPLAGLDPREQQLERRLGAGALVLASGRRATGTAAPRACPEARDGHVHEPDGLRVGARRPARPPRSPRRPGRRRRPRRARPRPSRRRPARRRRRAPRAPSPARPSCVRLDLVASTTTMPPSTYAGRARAPR